MKRKDIGRSLKDIKGCNQRLDKFIDKARGEEAPVTTKSSRQLTLMMPLEQIQECADNLHRSLSQAWRCTAHTSHYASLLIEHRRRSPKRKKQKAVREDDASTNFRISFNSPSLPTKWYDTEIQVRETTKVWQRYNGFFLLLHLLHSECE